MAAPAAPPLMLRMKAQMRLMIIMQRLEGAKKEGSSDKEEPEWDEDRVAMLKDSYRELTGHPMPAWMTPEQALMELKKYSLVFVEDEDEEAEADGGAEAEAAPQPAAAKRDPRSRLKGAIIAVKMLRRAQGPNVVTKVALSIATTLWS